jgi:hypothetical protein
MDIRNTTQFVNFIKKGGLENLDMNFLQLSQCVDKLAHACNCHRAEDKQKMHNNCNVIYMNAVRGVVPRFKNEFLSKTEDRQIQFFLENGSLIGLVGR